MSVEAAGLLPDAYVRGTKSKMRERVTVRNLTDSPINEPVTIDLFASDDLVISGRDARLAQLTRTLRSALLARQPDAVDQGRRLSRRLRRRPLSRARAGLRPAAGASETASGPGTVGLESPTRDLDGTFRDTPEGPQAFGRRGSAKIVLRNVGNTAASGRVTVTLEAVAAAAPIPLGTFSARVSLRPEASKVVFRTRFDMPATPGTYTLLGTIVASEEVGELNTFNNRFGSGPFIID